MIILLWLLLLLYDDDCFIIIITTTIIVHPKHSSSIVDYTGSTGGALLLPWFWNTLYYDQWQVLSQVTLPAATKIELTWGPHLNFARGPMILGHAPGQKERNEPIRRSDGWPYLQDIRGPLLLTSCTSHHAAMAPITWSPRFTAPATSHFPFRLIKSGALTPLPPVPPPQADELTQIQAVWSADYRVGVTDLNGPYPHKSLPR